MTDWSTRELMVVALARQFRDGDLAIAPGAGLLAAAALALAQRLGRWISWLSLPLGALDVRDDRLTDLADERLRSTASALLEPETVLDMLATPGIIDVAVLEPLQVDRRGNVNSIRRTTADGIVYGPGMFVDAAVGACAGRFLIALDPHDPTTVVERVEVCSGVGHHEGGDSRERRLGLHAGGPALVVTSVGCFDFEPATRALRVASLHAGITLEAAIAATGCPLITDGVPPETPPPTDEGLRLLRMAVDREGRLRASAVRPGRG